MIKNCVPSLLLMALLKQQIKAQNVSDIIVLIKCAEIVKILSLIEYTFLIEKHFAVISL